MNYLLSRPQTPPDIISLGADNTGGTDTIPIIQRAKDAGLKGLLIPPGRYRFDTDPVWDGGVDTIHLIGIGSPTFVLQSMICRRGDVKVDGVVFEKRAGSVEANAKGIWVDPVGAGRALNKFRFRDCVFNDFFYAIDGRGESTHHVTDIRYENCESYRTSGGNAGHFNWFYCDDVEQHGCHTEGGLNSASHNFGNGGGYLRSYGGSDKDCPASGGCINVENFFGSAKAQFFGGVWGYGMAAARDDYTHTVDDSEDVEIIAPDSSGYVRVMVSSGDTRRVKLQGGSYSRLRVLSQGGGNAVDYLDVDGVEFRGIPGLVNAVAAMSLDGNFLKRARIADCRVIRFQADNVSENFTAAMSIPRAAALDLDICGSNDMGGRPITCSGGVAVGKVRLSQDTLNYGALTQVIIEPALMPSVAGNPVTDAMFPDVTMRNGLYVYDTAAVPPGIKVRQGANNWV